MFFKERIRNINRGEKVLEIGPGGDPHKRADVFLELKYDDEDIYKAQRGNTDSLLKNNRINDKPVFFYDGKSFPFKDKEFDYIICSHVIEHVLDVAFFLEEVFRVGKKGYFEFPTINYEYLYNFKVHKNVLKYDGNKLFYSDKEKLGFDKFLEINAFFYQTLNKGYVKIIDDFKDYMFQGFEWENRFEYILTDDIKNLTVSREEIENIKYSPVVKERNIFKRIIGKIIK